MSLIRKMNIASRQNLAKKLLHACCDMSQDQKIKLTSKNKNKRKEK